ncbi:hypothetical protein SAMN05428964_105198 [Thalassospira xiamenensis]|uniref:Uncharacterized protein n=1 Tax=Thalassospira xiamenensis TaxID=220697 RepID=A0A285TS92_9PROT|nr:hypothetical protein SAMN05428964_105198 [Thalassospira xiamenensis]
MKHDWERHIPETMTQAESLLAEPIRRCNNCGAVQQLERTTAWGRTVLKHWLPLAGRCKPQKDRSQDPEQAIAR